MSDWTVEYKTKMREFIAKRGRAVKFEEKRWDFQADDDVSTYGWTDWQAEKHILPYDKKDQGCSWVVPEGARLYERSYSMFTDTFHSNEDEVGINVTGCSCACGKYTDVALRYVGSLAEVVREITGVPDRAEVIL